MDELAIVIPFPPPSYYVPGVTLTGLKGRETHGNRAVGPRRRGLGTVPNP